MRNIELEEELLGMPLYLTQQKEFFQAADVLGVIAGLREGVITGWRNGCLQKAYQSLSTKGVLPGGGILKNELLKLNCWSDTETTEKASNGWLLELTDKGKCPVSLSLGDNLVNLAKEVGAELEGLYRQNRIHSISQEIVSKSTNSLHGITELIDELNLEVYSSTESRNSGRLIDQEFSEDIENLKKGEKPKLIETGFIDIDMRIGGFFPGSLNILGARPGMGKTAMALDIAWKHAQEGRLVAYFTLEMLRIELARRLVSKDRKWNLLQARSGELDTWQVDEYERELGGNKGFSLWVDEANVIPEDIEARIRIINQKTKDIPLRLIVVDHLHNMGVNDQRRYEREDLRLGAYTAKLKNLAKNLNLPILLLSQLSRKSADRGPDERLPRLADFRGSGNIEQDADLMIGIYRRYEDTKNPADQNHCEGIILKNRNGPTGKFELCWLPTSATFTNLTKRPEMEHV